MPGELIVKYKIDDSNLPAALYGRSISEEDRVANLINSKVSINQSIKSRKLALSASPAQNKKLNSSSESSYMVIAVDESANIEAVTEQLNASNISEAGINIETVYPNYLYELQETSPVPNDTNWHRLWGLESINVREAWSRSDGEGVVVAIIDSGVDYRHADLRDNIWVNQDEIAGNGIDDDRNGYVDDVRGWDFISRGYNCVVGEDCSRPDNDPMDFDGHGTHCAGIVAATKDNNQGIVGVAPKAKIMPLRVAFSSYGGALLRSTDVVEAINYAVNNGADVVNMSFAGTKLGILEDIMNRAQAAGVTLVAAAGNASSNEKYYPAALDSVIAVGALAPYSQRASFSNYGDWIDIAAPGITILSTVPGGYDYKDGTSMSSPYVVGVLALIKSKNINAGMPELETVDIMMRSAMESNFSGAASLRSNNAVKALNADVNYPLQADWISAASEATVGEPIEFSSQASDGFAQVVGYSWRSDIDGFLSDQKNFSTDSLTQGTHEIFFKAGNSLGQWSEEVSTIVNVRDLAALAAEDLPTVKIKKRKRKLKAKVRGLKRNGLSVVSYSWRSDIDGALGVSKKIKLKDLSSGLHTIFLKVEYSDGTWSTEVSRTLER